MKSKTVLILILVCAVLAYFGLQESSSRKGINAIQDPKPFSDLDVNLIDEVFIQKGEVELVLKKEDERWTGSDGEMTFPIAFSKLKEMLLDVREVTWLSRPAQNRDLDEHFGLDEASNPLRVEYKVAGSALLSLDLGKGRIGESSGGSPFGPPEQGQYVRVDGEDGVYFAKDRLNLSVQPSNWIDTTFKKIDAEEISKVELSSLGRDLSFEKAKEEVRDAGGNVVNTRELWRAGGSLWSGVSADSSAVKNWVADLAEVTVQEPVPTSVRSTFPPKVDHHVRVLRGEEVLYDLEAQSVGGTWYIWESAHPEQIYQCSRFAIEDIFAKTDTLLGLKSKSLAFGGNVESIHWKMETLPLVQENGLWVVEAEGQHPTVNQDKVDPLLKALPRIEVLDFFGALDREVLGRLDFVVEGGAQHSLENLGEAPYRNAQLIRYEGEVLAVAKASYEKLFPQPSEVLNLASPLTEISKLRSLSFPDFKIEQSSTDTWTFADGGAVKEDSLKNWLSSYELIFESPYRPKGALGEPKLTLKLETMDESFDLQIGEATKGIVPVKTALLDGVFDVNLDLIRSLSNGKGYFLKLEDAVVEPAAEGETDPDVESLE